MSLRKKFPWLSLTLLLLTYMSLAWLLASFHERALIWAILAIAVLVLAAALSFPRMKLKDSFAFLFLSDTRSFFVAIIVAFLIVVILSWLDIFVHGLVAIAAGTLFRLEAQAAGLSETQTFWLIVIVSLAGLGLGNLGYTLLTRLVP